MFTDILPENNPQIIQQNQPLEILLILANLRNNIWTVGIPFWIFAITDRFLVTFTDGHVSATELTHLSIAILFFICWLSLKPETNWTHSDANLSIIPDSQTDTTFYSNKDYLDIAQARMLELRDRYVISQVYNLPFPYLCQVYHLLNLKHLESVHSFSLNNLRVVSVSHCQPMDMGGVIKFKTMLETPINALKIWRQAIVEVELTLHTPFTIELSIPAYNGKKIIVLFNILPLNQNEHKLFIDIYSDLKWYKPLLQILLHFASCLTMFEDLPYLQALAKRNLDRLVGLKQVSNHEMMWLMQRFVDLYGSNRELCLPQESSII